MKKLCRVLLLFASLSLVAARPAEAVFRFKAMLTHDQEVANPAIPNEGSSGIGMFELNDAMTALSYDVVLTGLDLDGLQTAGNANDNVTRVHFHAAPAGSNGGIVFGMMDSNAALRNDLDDLVVNPATGRITGVWDGIEGNNTTMSAQLNSLFANGLYFNIHTTDHGGGEIRGQIIFVPEPASLLLCLIGGLALASRRQRA